MISCRMVRRDEVVPDDAVDHGDHVALRQPIDGESGYVRLSDPRRLELWPERYEKQHAKCSYPVHHPTKHFQARRVRPMSILEDHQHGILACQRLRLRNQRFQCFLPTLLWGQVERRIASVIRQ